MNARIRALGLLLAVLFLGITAGAMGYRYYASKIQVAVAPPGPARDRQQRPRMQELLNMSEEQKTKFDEIWKEFRPQFEALRTAQEKKFDAVRAEVDPRYDELRAELNRRVLSILNEGQQQKYEALQKEMNARRVHRRTDRPGPPPPDGPGAPPERPGPPPQ
jgi:hypothetical protein